MSIVYLRGDARYPTTEGPKIIAHIVNSEGGWGKGFVGSLSKRWQSPEQYYRRWHKAKKDFVLGAVQVIQVEPDIWVANMLAQLGYATPNNPIPLRYEALRECLNKLAVGVEKRKASVHMPRIGCGLSGGTWSMIGPMVEECLKGHSVYVYSL